MASHDPAFQWETEVLRSSRRPRRADRRTVEGTGDRDDWLSVREASEATGVPASTIRKWVRHENIPSFMEQTSEGHLRIVSMSGIRRWTDEIGRRIDLPAVSEPVEDIARPSNDIDLTEPASTEAGVDEPVAAEGSMLVPLDAWNRMLNQLGNLHEAGQQLAEARERAAKAETEAHFLKERLADLRDELERAKEPTADETTREPTHERPSDEGVSTPSSPTALMRALYDGWRSRRRDRA